MYDVLTVNPNKRGIPATTLGGACWRFLSNYSSVVPSSPTKTGPPLVGEKTPTDTITIYIQNGPVFSGFRHFHHEKFFEVLIKFKKNGHTIYHPDQI